MKLKFHLLYSLIILLLVGGFLSVLFRLRPTVSSKVNSAVSEPKIHWHADLKVVLDNQPYDFSSFDESVTHNSGVHFHNPDFEVIHIHKFGTTWGNFFKSINGELKEDCLSLPNSLISCSNKEGRVIKFFVNGGRVDILANKPIMDLERVLIYFGKEKTDEEILASPTLQVSYKSCIYDKICPKPEGMTLNEESCTADQPCIKE